MVKANAYGHGAVRVGLALEARRRVDAGLRRHRRGRAAARRAGVTVPILVFGALSVGDVDGIFDYELTPDGLDAVGGADPRRRRRARAQACGCRVT